jgi:hypothetical protein
MVAVRLFLPHPAEEVLGSQALVHPPELLDLALAPSVLEHMLFQLPTRLEIVLAPREAEVRQSIGQQAEVGSRHEGSAEQLP